LFKKNQSQDKPLPRHSAFPIISSNKEHQNIKQNKPFHRVKCSKLSAERHWVCNPLVDLNNTTKTDESHHHKSITSPFGWFEAITTI